MVRRKYKHRRADLRNGSSDLPTGTGALFGSFAGESDGGPVLEANTDSDGDGSDGGLVLEANSA